MKKFSALLQYKWYLLSPHGDISGKLAEDETLYQISCPPQLVDSIVAMQHYCFDVYQDIKAREKEIENLKQELESFKIARGL